MSTQKIRSVARPRWRSRLIAAHRWLGVAAAAFWLLQAATGILIVFHWELDDATLAGPRAVTDLPALEARLAALAPAQSGRHVTSIWTSAGARDRYDVHVAQADGGSRVIRIAGDGTVLRDMDGKDRTATDTIVVLHQTLLAGKAGGWIVGISGVLLLSNLAAGAFVAWPRRGNWARAVVPIRSGGPTARAYSWHRALGLIGVVPAILLVSAGILRVFEDGTARLIGTVPIKMAAQPGEPRIGFAAAIEAALRAMPGSTLTAVTGMPGSDDATWRIRLLAPDERRRAYGMSTVFVDAIGGRVRGIYPASAAPLANGFMDTLYAIHTGEVAGIFGRLLVLTTGLWLATMIVLGVILWQRRRRPRPARA
jgi:uncharacterized iron-regulated membrane protein